MRGFHSNYNILVE